jgi:hypothetical protein
MTIAFDAWVNRLVEKLFDHAWQAVDEHVEKAADQKAQNDRRDHP